MKFNLLILFSCITCACNAQLTEYRMLFPFPYNPDSIAERHIHKIEVQTFLIVDSLPSPTKPNLIKTFNLDGAGRLRSTYISSCETCAAKPTLIVNPDSGTVKLHKTKYNSKGQLIRDESSGATDVYGYDAQGRISFHSFFISLSAVDTSYQTTYHHYGVNGKPEWSLRYDYMLHYNPDNGRYDTVGTHKSFARYFFKGNKLNYVLADLPSKLSTESTYLITYKYADRRHYEVRFIKVDGNKTICFWKVTEFD